MTPASSSSKPAGPWQPPSLEDMQAMLPQYRFLSLLGRGGMGAVYKAVQTSLDRVVAIKILPGALSAGDDGGAEFAERFKNEARTMARMKHPGIVNVWDFGQTGTGMFYIVMEFMDGTDAAQLIRAQGRLPEAHALSITAHVCDALAYAHAHGVIHRDIKPANILIKQTGEVKVADFGLAKRSDPALSGLTKTNMAMGTPDFLAPEALIPGIPLDGRADLYAVGVMLYQMLTGELPRGIWELPGARLGTDPRFDEIITRAMQADRDARYQSAAEIRQALDTILTRPKPAPGPRPAPEQRHAAQKPAAPPPRSPTGARRTRITTAGGQAAPKPGSSALKPLLAAAALATAGIMLIPFLMPGGKDPPVVETAAAPETPPPLPSPAPANAPAAAKAPGFSNHAPGASWRDEMAAAREWGPRWSRAGAEMHNTSGENAAHLLEKSSGDQGLRVRFRSRKKGAFLDLFLRLNKTGNGPRYIVTLLTGDKMEPSIDLIPPKKDGDRRRSLARAGEGTPSDTGVEHTAEFHASGPRLSFYLDGRLLASAVDTTLPAGFPGIAAASGIELISFESTLPDTPPAAAPAAKAAPAPPAPAAPATGWQPVFTAEMKQKTGVTELADGWVRMENAYRAVNMGKDMALRGRLRLGPGRDYAWPVRFRDHSRGGLMHYGLMLSKNGDITLHRRVQTGSQTTADDKALMKARHPGGFAEGAEFDLEITAHGDRLQVKINGETLVDVNDTFHQGTRTDFGSDTAIIEFQNLEWRALPAP